MHRKQGILAIALGTLVSAGAIVAGCSDDPATTTDAGTAPTGTTTATGTTTGTTPTDSGPASTLYDRLGKIDGIRGAVKAIVVEELKNDNIKSYFFFQLKGEKPTPADIEECLSQQLAAAAGGPEKYPLTLPSGYACRGDMKATHERLHIPGATFDKFIEIAGGVLTAAKVAPADIQTVATVLIGMKGQVVDPQAPAGDFKPPTDAGGGG
jgi:hypothetical protein